MKGPSSAADAPDDGHPFAPIPLPEPTGVMDLPVISEHFEPPERAKSQPQTAEIPPSNHPHIPL